MSRQIIDTTTNNGSYIGDPALIAFNKVNTNFAALMDSQSAGYVWIAPSGAAGEPVFRRLVAADIPATLNATTVNGVLTITGSPALICPASTSSNVAVRPQGPSNATGQFVIVTDGRVQISGHVYPEADGGATCGRTTNRWSQLVAQTTTISTSDGREKDVDQTTMLVVQLTDNEMECGLALGREIGWYRFLASIEKKGDAARRHIGMTVQRAIEIMNSYGLDPMQWSFICYDEWDAAPAIEGIVPAAFDKEGNVTTEESSTVIVPSVEAGNRYGFRESGLYAFILRSYIQKQDVLTSRIAALEAAAE